jgi:phage N-6-adenine-methyltransferase
MSNMVDKHCVTTRWLTPERILEPVRAYFGGEIPLDPATECDNPTKARAFFTRDGADGLSMRWDSFGGVFVNPPYGRVLKQWTKKIAEEAEDGTHIVALLPGQRFETQYWQDDILNDWLDAIVMIRKRLSFVRTAEGTQGSNPYGSMLYIFNAPSQLDVMEAFSKLGKILYLDVIVPEGTTRITDVQEVEWF